VRADVAVVGWNLAADRHHGLELCVACVSGQSPLPVIVLTGCVPTLSPNGPGPQERAAYVVARASPDELARTVRDVARGRPPRSFVVDPHRVVENRPARLSAALDVPLDLGQPRC
jgi:hypothetical protein